MITDCTLHCGVKNFKAFGKKVLIGIIAILVVAIFTPSLISMAGRWQAADSYYSHGYLVPLISAYLVWRRRSKLRSLLPPQPCKVGLVLLSGGLFLHLVSSFLKINFGTYVSFPIVLTGLVLYLLGKRIARELLFPIAFLIFMIPLPSVIIIHISFKMKMLAAHIASGVVNMMGISTLRDGSTIYLPNGSLVIGDPCSGLRSLISLLALGAVFTQFMSGSIGKKNILFFSAVPIALGSNVLRIISLLLVTHVYGEDAALGFFHDLSGISVFAFAFIGLAIVVKILRCQIAIKTT